MCLSWKLVWPLCTDQVAYYRQGKAHAFTTILQEGIDDGA